MNPFHRLGLRPGADAREIKRAYARLLKTARPDDDAAAFQTLNEAYRAALAMASEGERARAPAAPAGFAAPEPGEAVQPEGASPPGPLSETTVGPGSAAPAAAADEPPAAHTVVFDFGAFSRDLADHCREGRAEALIGWLYSIDALYDIDLKQRIGHALFDWLLHDGDAPVPQPSQLEQLGTFFGLDFSRLERINAARWAIRHEQTRRYGEPRPLAVRQLKRRFGWVRALLLSAVPGMNRRIGTLAWRLAHDAGGIPAGIEPRQYEWFTRLADDGFMGRARWISMAGAAVVWSVAICALVALLVLPGGEADVGGVVGVALTLAVGFAALQVATALFRWLQARMAADHVLGWRLGVGLPLVLAALAAAGGGSAAEGQLWPYAPALAAIVLATRHWGRMFDALRVFLAAIWLLQWKLGTDAAPMLALAGAAAGLVAFDAAYAWRHGLPFAASLANRWLRIGSYVALGGGLLVTAMLGGSG